MIQQSTFDFLKELKENNNREWFTENKNLYVAAHENVLNFVEKLLVKIAVFDEEIAKIDAKKTLFRIYRDTRFSKDKSPYKTNFGASIGMGKGNQKAGYYLHIEPSKSFLAGGIYMPESSALKKVRKEISLFSTDFMAVIENKNFKKNFSGLDMQNILQKVPQGFEKDDPMSDYLKLKSYVVLFPLNDEDFESKESDANFAKIYKAIKPLNDFLNTAIES